MRVNECVADLRRLSVLAVEGESDSDDGFVADSCSIPWDIDAVGTCGGLQPCNDAKVVDVPEMGVNLCLHDNIRRYADCQVHQ